MLVCMFIAVIFFKFFFNILGGGGPSNVQSTNLNFLTSAYCSIKRIFVNSLHLLASSTSKRTGNFIIFTYFEGNNKSSV